jgi:hypothetical protein
LICGSSAGDAIHRLIPFGVDGDRIMKWILHWERVPATRLFLMIAVASTLSACGYDDWPKFTLAYSVAAGDLNGDGRVDLASGNTFFSGPPFTHPGHVSVLLQGQSSPGTFGSAANLDAGNETIAVAFGDLNGDNLMDIVAANEGSGSISIFFQDAASPGTWLPAKHVAVGNYPHGLAIGDIDGDGSLDLAVADFGLSILFQDPNAPGTFLRRTSLGVECSSVAIDDFNADGRPDLVATATNAGYVTIHLQDSADVGVFLPPQRVPAGLQPIDVAIDDLNGDSLPDFAVANYGAPDDPATASLSVFLNDVSSPGNFPPGRRYATGWNTRARAVVVGDLNNDGLSDLAVASTGQLIHSGPPPEFYPGSISVLFQDPGTPGSFFSAVNMPDKNGPLDVAIADLNGDGLADLAQSDQGFEDDAKLAVRIRFQLSGQPGRFGAPVLVGN